MDNAETNGCEDGPLALSVTNHTETTQGNKNEKPVTKIFSAATAKVSRTSSGGVANSSSRSRRKTPQSVPPNLMQNAAELPASEKRRAVRHAAATSSPSKSVSDKKSAATAVAQPSPASNAHAPGDKTAAAQQLQPPTLLPQVTNSADTSDGPAEVICTSVGSKHTKRPQLCSVNSSPPLLTSQKRSPKRSSSSPSSPKKSLAIESDLSAPRASKRIRLQHQPFQSPPPPTIIPAILRQHAPKCPEDKICVFQKGEFLAVRNETGSFFVCRTAQNVYKSSKRFKIQWMSDQAPDLYIPDFYDQTDFECVLTNLRMKRVDKNKFRLPAEERQRTLNILQRALNVENGIDISKFQVSTDGVDVSIVGKEEELLRLQEMQEQQNLPQQQLPQQQQQQSPKQPDAKNKSPPTRTKIRTRKLELRPSPKNTRSSDFNSKKLKTVSAKVKLRSRETVKVKLKKEGGKIIVSNKTGKPVPKLRKIVERLHPNSNVTIFEKDPTFEMNVPIPYVSSSAHSKLLIRAIHLKDINMLNSLIKDTQRVCTLDCPRSVDIPLTPLAYAVLEEDHRAIKAFLCASRKKYANPPETLLEHHSTGRQNLMMLGHAVKAVQPGRGGREGNNAFLKDLSFCNRTYPIVDSTLVKEALRVGVCVETLNVLFSVDGGRTHSTSWQRHEVFQHIIVAIRNGHHKLAGQLISEAINKGGYGFGNLHKEVLVKERQALSKFRPVSVVKKTIGRTNARVTPLHCAAINPNPQYLAELLSVSPEYNIADDNGWRPIHYAAVCKSTGPLELLISRNISLEEVESEGNTPLHTAAAAGRAHNVDLILRHFMTSDSGRKEGNTVSIVQDKTNFAVIDRGNKKSFTPLHLACQNGHIDVVRVLLRHKATVDKVTNAQHDRLTPLMLASQKGHLDIVRVLIEHTARIVETKDKRQRTALTHAVINGHAHVTSYLLRLGANPNTTDSSGNTLVHYAAAYGWYFCVKLLVEAGASLNLPNDWKITPLSLAFMKGHMGLVDFLVEQPGIDVSVDVHNDSGMTLVMQALRSRVNHSMLERVHFLVVKQKCDCGKIDFMGNNALHHLVVAEVEEVKTEIKKEGISQAISSDSEDDVHDEASTKLDQNSSSKFGDEDDEEQEEHQLFMEEAQQEHDALVQEITKLLLDHGCDPMMKNKESESPFNMAVKEGCLLLVKMFLDAGCHLSLEVSSTGDNILHYLVSHARQRKVEPMLQAILNAKCSETAATPHQLLCEMAKMYNNNGHTPLLQALNTMKSCKEEARNRLLSFMKFLIDELGADVAACCKDENGKKTSSALHLAVLCKGSQVIETLLSHKAPLNTLNVDGQTPLVLAIKQENVEAIEALVRAGAMVNMKSMGDGNLSPLILASMNPKLGKVVQFLVHNKADVHDIHPKNKNTALHYVVSIRASDVLETAKALLTAGANVNAVNDHRRTPLHLAVNASSSDSDASYAVEECLLGFGAKADAIDCRGRTPLQYAFTKIGRHTDNSPIDPMELIVLLVDAMPDTAIEIPDNFGQTLLHAAARRGATISSMHIAKHMKNIDVKDKNSNTPLGLAVRNGHESCTLMLLQRGASCFSDLVLVDEKQSEKRVGHWEWSHVARKEIVPKKHTILQETLLKDWQGILYLMLDQLDAMGKGINIAVEAALRTAKYNVALKLIGKVKHSWTLYSDKQSMLHVLAREAPANYFPELQVKVAQFLIEKGVAVMRPDEHGCSVLTYSAINWNHTLCSFFSGKMGISAAAQVEQDKSCRTPLSAIFWRLGSNELPEEMKNWCANVIKAGGNINILSHYPVHSSPFPGVSYLTMDDVLHIEDASVPKISPLIMAVCKRNYAVVKFLISQNADINFADSLQQTPLMHAVKLNDIKMVKLLLNNNYDPFKDENPFSDIDVGSFQKTTSLSLSECDINGFTVVHHLVSPLPDYCYSNCNLLYLLAEMGAPLETCNKAGETPLAMAVRLKRAPMIAALQDLLNIPSDKRVFAENPPSPELSLEPFTYDFKSDCKNYLSTCTDAIPETEQNYFKPDPSSGMDTTGEVVNDPSRNIPFDALMTVVDLNYGAYGIYNFYKMQIIKHKMKELFVLFTAWGRVGDTGQNQRTPYSCLSDAVKEFCRIFKAKSGNHWEDIENFQPQPKKYRLVHLEKRKHFQRQSLKINFNTEVPSRIDVSLVNLMDDLMDVSVLEGTLHDLGVNMAFDVLPFGSLSESSLSAAQDMLKEIGQIISERDSLQQNAKSQEKFSEFMHKIVKLSEDFYQLVPVYGYEYERLSPLFCSSDVHEKLTLIHNLQHIGLTGEMLLSANFRKNEINPHDYVYKSLGIQLSCLNKESQEAQMILQYIHNTSMTSARVQSIYSIHKAKESGVEESLLTSQRYLLWHGTRMSNVLAILTRGLQPSPLGVPISGSSFGKGIYLADMFAKSAGYCHSSSKSGQSYMFLCEADLSSMKEVDSSVVISCDEKHESIKVLGRIQPDPVESVSWKGMTVPLGHPISVLDQEDTSQHRFLKFNEYVVRRSEQVRIRYLIVFS